MSDYETLSPNDDSIRFLPTIGHPYIEAPAEILDDCSVFKLSTPREVGVNIVNGDMLPVVRLTRTEDPNRWVDVSVVGHRPTALEIGDALMHRNDDGTVSVSLTTDTVRVAFNKDKEQ